ncbi:MAG: hypothetical protein LUB59_03745 [Candidatus Gastranaerophilales bacterium]|nr:hypothetical protein [Candidatus Gastranaerophilales bacterium]
MPRAKKVDTETAEIVEGTATVTTTPAIVESTPVVEKPAAKKTRRKFAQDDPILCRSVTYGELLLPGKKSKLLYTFANYGDTTEVEFQDLQALRSTKSKYLNMPYFVIEDEELLEQWPEMKAIHDKAALVDINAIFKMPVAQMKKRLKELPAGMRETVKNMASEKIQNGSLDSIAKINAIDEIYNTNLKFYINN